MYGAIAGDIIGSIYERNNLLSTEFPLFAKNARFTDDTTLTIAVADALLSGATYQDRYQYWGLRYFDAGYGKSFKAWLKSANPQPYQSWGNGSAMRVSPVGYVFDTLEATLDEAARSAMPTHDHPEGIKGAQAVAACVFLARRGADKTAIRQEVETRFGYDLSRSLAEMALGYRFDVSCAGSVPQAIRAFLESDGLESAIRLAISIGGDSDTIAAIAGSIAEPFYGGVPEPILEEVRRRLPPEMDLIARNFAARFL